MKKFIFLIPFFAFLLPGFAQQHEKKISVAVAANMQFTMEQLKTEFEKETGIKVAITTGASGNLSAQIMEDAPFDVFVSADMKYPEEVYKKGFAAAPPKVYANGSLVLWTARKDIKPDGNLHVLFSAQVKKIAIANPKTAPYGVAAEEAMKYYKVYGQVKEKLVYGESIAQAQQFISSQAADIGFMAKSIVLSDEMKGKGSWIDIDKGAYTPIAQGAVMLKHGREANSEAAGKFYTFLYSDKARPFFKKYGYIVHER